MPDTVITAGEDARGAKTESLASGRLDSRCGRWMINKSITKHTVCWCNGLNAGSPQNLCVEALRCVSVSGDEEGGN